jgi:hypothetical protein
MVVKQWQQGQDSLIKKVNLDRSVWWGRLENRSVWTGQRGLGGLDSGQARTWQLWQGRAKDKSAGAGQPDRAAGIGNPGQARMDKSVCQVILERTEGTGQPWQDSAQCSEHIYFAKILYFREKIVKNSLRFLWKCFENSSDAKISYFSKDRTFSWKAISFNFHFPPKKNSFQLKNFLLFLLSDVSKEISF